MKILVVDDSPTMRDITSSTLRAADYEVLEAEHGEEGLEVLSNTPVDLIISDLNMYKMGGFEFVSRVRALPEYEYTPIMFLTTEDSDDFKRVGREVGASGWMVKPFEPKELIKVVKKLAQ